MPTIETFGATIWFDTDGPDAGGPAVLLVHGMSGTHAVWRNQLEALHLAGYRTVVLDRRGAGNSSASRPPTGNNVGDILAVLDHLRLDQVHVVGHALGAADVLELAVHHSARVASMTLSNGHGGVADGPYATWRSRIWAPQLMALPAHLRELSPTYRATRPAGTTQWCEIAAAAQPEDLAVPARRPVHVSDLATLRRPALFLAGDADLLTPPFLLRTLAETVPGSRFAVVTGTGHVSHWEQPEEWNRIVLEFLGSTEGQAISQTHH